MARENYLSLSVTPSEMQIFDCFVKEKGLTKAAALQDMLEIYMLATDEEAYLRLKRKVLAVDAAKQLLEQRAQRQSHLAAPFVFDSFWMRATEVRADVDGWESKISAKDMINIYNRVSTTHGSVWFSCNGPARKTGISESRMKYIWSLLESGLPVKIYVSDTDTGQMYSADVEDVISESAPFRPEGIEPIPEEFLFEKNRVWMKIGEFRLESADAVVGLKFENGGSLVETIGRCQLSFGYLVSE